MKKADLSLETAIALYNEGGASRQFALDNNTEKELTKKPLPTTFEDLDEILGYYVNAMGGVDGSEHDKDYFHADEYNKNVFPTREEAEAVLALAQLSQLKKVYCDGLGS